MNNCIFCEIASGKTPTDKIYEDQEIIAFNDISPKASVHILVVPKHHISSVNDLTESDVSLIGKIILKAKDIAAEKGLSENGFRLVFNIGRDSGQEVNHIHLHILGGEKLGPMA